MPTQEDLLDGIAAEKLFLDPSVPENVISYCPKCDRFFDVRSGCEADIKSQETAVEEHHKDGGTDK